MPVKQVLKPTTTIAAGVVLADGKEVTISHQYLTGNPAGKRQKLLEAAQGYIDTEGASYTNINDLDPITDPDHPAHAAHPGYPVVTDCYGITDDGTTAQVTVRYKRFIWDDGVNKKYLVIRNAWVYTRLIMENDPTLGNNDRYESQIVRIK